MAVEWTEAEIRRMLWLRAIEWCSWPSFLSLVLAPIVFLWLAWWKVLLGLLIANVIWAPFRYRFHNLRIANFASTIINPGQYIVAVTCSIIQAVHRHWGLAVLSLVWPVVGGFVKVPGGKIGIIEQNFASELQLIDPESD
ncbi:MAG: hypothetical protein WCF30_14425 [Terracidiphilus sp.]